VYWCCGYVRVHVCCLGCVGRMATGGHCLYVSDVLLVLLFEVSSGLSDVRYVTGVAGEFVNPAFFVLLGCFVRL
jgi:hypothetical protein